MTGKRAISLCTTLEQVRGRLSVTPELTAISVSVSGMRAPVLITCADTEQFAAWTQALSENATLTVRHDLVDTSEVRLTATDPRNGLDYVVSAPAIEICERFVARGRIATITAAALRGALPGQRSGEDAAHRSNLRYALATIQDHLSRHPSLYAARLRITRIADTPPVVTRTSRFPRWTGSHTEVHCGTAAALLRWHDSINTTDRSGELRLTAHRPDRHGLILRITAVLDRSAITVLANAAPLTAAFAELRVGGKCSIRATDMSVVMTGVVAKSQHRDRVRAELGFQGER